MSSVFNGRLRAAFAPPEYIAPSFAGIDLSSSGVKAVRLVEGARGLALESSIEVRLPSGAFADGEIIDRTAVIEALSAAARATGIRAANVALPESKSYLFETVAVGTNKTELRTSIEQHLDEFVPLPPAETVFDFVTVGVDGNGGSRAACVGFARRIIDETISAFEEAGIEVRGLEGEVFASSRAILAPDDQSTVLIIDVGKTTTKISIVARRIPRFAATIAIGGHALTLAVQKYFGVTENEARRVKSERGIAPAPGNEEYLAAMLSTVSAIRDEISRHLAYWQERAAQGNSHELISHVLLIGGNAAVRGLPEYLEESLKLPVTAGNVFLNLSSRPTRPTSFEVSEAFAYATAIGLALRDNVATYAQGDLTNLLPHARRRLLAREYCLHLGTVVAFLLGGLFLSAAALLMPIHAFLVGSASSKEEYLASMKASISFSDEMALSNRLIALSSAATVLTELSAKPSVSTVMRSVLAVPHPDIALSGFDFSAAENKNASTLVVTGTAATRAALRAYQLALENASFARSVDLPVSVYAKDTNISFIITITLAP